MEARIVFSVLIFWKFQKRIEGFAFIQFRTIQLHYKYNGGNFYFLNPLHTKVDLLTTSFSFHGF